MCSLSPSRSSSARNSSSVAKLKGVSTECLSRSESARRIAQWHDAGVIDAATRDRLLAYEEAHARPLLLWAVWGIGALANPGLAQSARDAPVVVSGTDCTYDPFASQQKSECGRLLGDLTSFGISYEIADRGSSATGLAIGNRSHNYEGMADADRKLAVQSWLEAAGYDFSVQRPPFANLVGIVGLLLGCGILSALTYGSVAALLAEMFPPQIRYSSMSIPYHIGAGYLGGFLPLIAGYIVATTGDPYSGLWYTWGIVAFGLVVAWWGIRGGPPRDFTPSDDAPPVSPSTP